jgi:polyhydroxybutyrate depolymerase
MKQLMIKRGMLLALFVSALSFSNCQKGQGGNTYRYNGVMDVDGWTRTYLLYLPPNYYDTAGFPLVILLHGFGGSAKQAEADYGVTDKANAEHFVVVYPEGIQSDGPYRLRSWNAGNCCFAAQGNGINDVHFISNLIDWLAGHYKIDPKRVYVAGMSNGSMMAYTLACQLSGKIAAITSVSGTLIAASPCVASRPVPIQEIHSSLDTKVPFNGGYGLDQVWFPAVDSGLNVWAMLDSCTSPQVTPYSGYTLTEWKNNNGNAMIDCYLTEDGGHSWPGGLKPREQADPPSVYLNATDLMWNFFQRYTLP